MSNTPQTIPPAQTKELAWLRKCTVPAYYEAGAPSSFRHFRYAWIDASGAWACNQFALHFVPRAVCDLTALADERRFIRLYDDSLPLAADVKPKNAYEVYEPDQAFLLFEYDTKKLKQIVETLRRGLRRDRDFGVLNVVRTVGGSVEMNLKLNADHQHAFQQFSVALPFGTTMARVEFRLDVVPLHDALDGMRTKTVQVRYQHKQNRIYLHDGHGRAALIMGLQQTK